MWIESMIGFGIQCNTEGLQIDKAGLCTQKRVTARVRAWRLELFELFLPEQERTEHQQFWIINSETSKAFLTALAISNAPENDEKRR